MYKFHCLNPIAEVGLNQDVYKRQVYIRAETEDMDMYIQIRGN